jgi:thymidylate synthase
MNKLINKTIKKLFLKGKESNNLYWQSIQIDDRNPIIEIKNINLEFKNIINPIDEFNPNLPWAEDHFLERVNGKPINPGEQYKNWPYYKNIDNDILFRSKGIFSHNYMERYWCSGYKGIRFQYGDLNDIINKLKNNPYSRQAFLSVWHPEDQSNHLERVPCTIGYWFNAENNILNITYLIRSCDAIRHFKNDLYMTYRLLQFVADNIGFKYGNMNVWIGSFHCFKSDLYSLKKQI